MTSNSVISACDKGSRWSQAFCFLGRNQAATRRFRSAHTFKCTVKRFSKMRNLRKVGEAYFLSFFFSLFDLHILRTSSLFSYSLLFYSFLFYILNILFSSILYSYIFSLFYIYLYSPPSSFFLCDVSLSDGLRGWDVALRTCLLGACVSSAQWRRSVAATEPGCGALLRSLAVTACVQPLGCGSSLRKKMKKNT